MLEMNACSNSAFSLRGAPTADSLVEKAPPFSTLRFQHQRSGGSTWSIWLP